MRPVHLLILVIVGAAIAFGIAAANKKQQASNPAPAPILTEPPPGATFIEAGLRPEDVIRADQMLVGHWVPEPGWHVNPTEVKDEGDGLKSLRVPLPQSNPIWGPMYLVVVVPEETQIYAGQYCMVTGRIAEVSKFQDGGVTDGHRVIVRDAKVKKL